MKKIIKSEKTEEINAYPLQTPDHLKKKVLEKPTLQAHVYTGDIRQHQLRRFMISPPILGQIS